MAIVSGLSSEPLGSQKSPVLIKAKRTQKILITGQGNMIAEKEIESFIFKAIYPKNTNDL